MKDGLEIVLVNDNKKEQDFFSFALNDLHVSYTCRFAKNAAAAIKLLGTVIPDYIFIDVHEPKLAKLINLKQVKKADHLKNTSFIIYSEDIADELNAKALRLGASMCIGKAETISDLIYTLKNIIVKNINLGLFVN